MVLKYDKLNDDDDEPDAQTAARSIGSVALYAKATELQVLSELKFDELKFCEMKVGELKRNRTVHLSLSPTARHLSPSRNISSFIYLVYLFRADRLVPDLPTPEGWKAELT